MGKNGWVIGTRINKLEFVSIWEENVFSFSLFIYYYYSLRLSNESILILHVYPDNQV